MWSSGISGTIAAVSGMLGKLSSDDNASVIQTIQAYCHEHQHAAYPWLDCAWAMRVVHVAFFAAMLLSNAVMLSFFVRGLHETDSLTATITSSAANFVVTALVGYLVFHEQLPLQWWVGASVILFGMGLLLHGAKDDITTDDSKAKKSA
ncbi:hypothetical protein H257_02421 [Aphanomyces astaci]|uniref:Uncharacterized protein n=1 Tax=Aphanomyces astaci TaxID=112090 RepID=W4H3N1_APHAT|nr:hypothetical protein H257_02421 [Aphanomyces astaci]ETV85874.1 hypothetical protein H257_02421 [Aphanomyces astaci]|eukprot:XP_009824346.1 hypothetical protein H257_02421 [Aphanomyces astaci]